MDLIPRYLQAVRFWLPKKQQDDIIAELSEDIHAQMAEREAALGRPLTDADVEALLRKRGSPIRVANGFLPQQQLIGPLLFPPYVFVLKVVSLCIVIPWAVGLLAAIIGQSTAHGGWGSSRVVGIAGHFWAAWSSAMHGVFTGWLVAMGVVTLVFAILERTDAKTKLLECWNPRKLPALRTTGGIPRSSSVIEIAFYLCVLLWWVAFMSSPVDLHLGTLRFSFTPLWTWFYWGILLLVAADASIAGLNLLRPCWTPTRIAARLSLDLAGGVLFCWFLKANIVANITWPGAAPEKAAAATAGLHWWLAQLFPWAVAVTVLIVAANAWQMIRAMRKAERRPMRAVAALF